MALREYGKDEDSTQALIKKHEAIDLEIDGYKVKIDELCAESQRLVDAGHFDSKVIIEKEVRDLSLLISHIVYTCTCLKAGIKKIQTYCLFRER